MSIEVEVEVEIKAPELEVELDDQAEVEIEAEVELEVEIEAPEVEYSDIMVEVECPVIGSGEESPTAAVFIFEGEMNLDQPILEVEVCGGVEVEIESDEENYGKPKFGGHAFCFVLSWILILACIGNLCYQSYLFFTTTNFGKRYFPFWLIVLCGDAAILSLCCGFLCFQRCKMNYSV